MAIPSVKSLQATLLLILEEFDDVFIVLDALDECAKRNDVLKWIEEMTSWRKGKLHLLATSRPVEGIAKYLRLLDPDHVYIRQDLITPDVERYIDFTLRGENAFNRWNDKIKANIKCKLMESAGGMFVLF